MKKTIKKLLAASIAALALFALTGCQTPANDNSDSNESTVLKTSYSFVLGTYKNKEALDEVNNCWITSNFRTLEITENDKYILYVDGHKETGKVVFSRFFTSDKLQKSFSEFKLLPETENANIAAGKWDDPIEYYYFWYESFSSPVIMLDQERREINQFIKDY